MSKVAIITGASSGIGRACTIALAKDGWSVVLFARRIDSLEETREACPNPEQCLCVEGDVANDEEVSKLFQKTIERFGRLDLLFNNAGTGAPPMPLEELPASHILRVMNVNVIGTFLCTREAVKIFKAQNPPGGRIINNGSMSAYTPRPHSAPYTASKHAVAGLTKSTLLDGRSFNITATQIDIGNARTDIASGLAMGAMQADGRVVPEPMMELEDVGKALVYLANLPNELTSLTFNVMPTGMPFVGRG